MFVYNSEKLLLRRSQWLITHLTTLWRGQCVTFHTQTATLHLKFEGRCYLYLHSSFTSHSSLCRYFWKKNVSNISATTSGKMHFDQKICFADEVCVTHECMCTILSSVNYSMLLIIFLVSAVRLCSTSTSKIKA